MLSPRKPVVNRRHEAGTDKREFFSRHVPDLRKLFQLHELAEANCRSTLPYTSGNEMGFEGQEPQVTCQNHNFRVHCSLVYSTKELICAPLKFLGSLMLDCAHHEYHHNPLSPRCL